MIFLAWMMFPLEFHIKVQITGSSQKSEDPASRGTRLPHLLHAHWPTLLKEAPSWACECLNLRRLPLLPVPLPHSTQALLSGLNCGCAFLQLRAPLGFPALQVPTRRSWVLKNPTCSVGPLPPPLPCCQLASLQVNLDWLQSFARGASVWHLDWARCPREPQKNLQL